LGYPDDLAEVKGIGEVYRRRLYAAGLFTWQQVAQADVETLRTITKAQASANVEEWPAQAQALAEQHDRLDASYAGPPPDDLTAISGIGPVSAQQLYRAGICTYEQLAAALPDELAPLLTAPVAGHEYDFSTWLARAVELAAAKRTATAEPT
jgi:predicted flap endonuclease-1-like 5' DNA nuclease